MITTLDTLSWSPELVTGNAEFIELAAPGFGSDFGHDFGGGGAGPTIFVISNVRNISAGFGMDFGSFFGSQYGFEVLQSQPTPPTPGPGSAFDTVASYQFPQPNYTFDPVACYDASGIDPLIHIVGTRNTPTGTYTSSIQSSDIIKFTYNTVTNALTGPIVLSSGTRIRSAYDIAVLPNGNQIVVMSLAEPSIQGTNPVFSVSVENGIATLSLVGDILPFVSGQWVLLNGFTNATFLNGQIVQVISASAGEFSFAFQLPSVGFGINFGSMFGSYFEPEPTGGPVVALAAPIGDSLLAVELDANVAEGFGINFGFNFGVSEVLPGSATIIDSSPSRTGNAFDGVSLVPNGSEIELYYQSHPKLVTFQDQIFTINFTTVTSGFGTDFGYSFGTGVPTWSLPATSLTSYTARYADKRLTVLADAAGNRYLSETYWSQFNHPQGILGSVLLGFMPSGGTWSFHPTLGTFAGGSIIQSTLALDQNGDVSLVYLLQPFTAVANPPTETSASYPLQVASVNTNNLSLTNTPGFFNTLNFTWLRGTKSIIDNGSVWAVVGERDVLTTVSGEVHTIPNPPGPYAVQIDQSPYYENVSVSYFPELSGLTQVATDPSQGQYTVEPSTGLYGFSAADSGLQVAFSYNYISGIAPSYVSLFNVPPIAALTPTTVTVWRNSTYYSIDISSITQVAITNTSVTITCANDFVIGERIALYGIGTATQLNGIVLIVTFATATSFTAAFSSQSLGLGLGFGLDFGFGFSNYSQLDTGSAAALISGPLTFSAAGSTDADNDAMEFFWTENDPDLIDVTLTPSADLAVLNVAKAAGPQARLFDVGVAVVDLFSDLVTQRHPALIIFSVSVPAPPAASDITVIFAPPGQGGFGTVFGTHFGSAVPSGSVVPVVGDQVMLYGVILSAPQAPTLGQVVGGSLPAQSNLSVIVTYVNNAGETVGSGNSILSIAANHLLTVASPGNNGSATGYNVYVGPAGSETIQTLTPQPLGSTFTESTGGFIASFQKPPATNGALEQALNDQVLDVTSVTATSFTAPFTLAGNFGIDFGNNFNGNYIASLTGFAIKEFQWERAVVTVPQNVAPTISFPALAWEDNALPTASITATSVSSDVLTVTCVNQFIAGQTVALAGTEEGFLNGQTIIVLSASNSQFTASFVNANYTNASDTGTASVELPRNTSVTITPNTISNPVTQLPVVYTGIFDPDDSITYKWTQTSGTPLVLSGSAGSSLTFNTSGVNINGETLTFSLTVNDSVNPAVTVNFSVSVAAYNFEGVKDSTQLSRSVWSQTANVTNVSITGGVATITANNFFIPGEPVRFVGLVNASFLNNVIGFYVATASAIQFTFTTTLPNYPSLSDSGVSYASTPLSQRNSPQVWSPMDISVIFSNLNSVKRTSVLDGSDRYIVISPYSVLVYGVFPSANPVAVLLRRLLTPNRTVILDAVHTEQDYTLVLDAEGNIFRYSSAPLIDTDNPDTTLLLADITSISFADPDLDGDSHILTTQSFADNRILVLTGENGAVLLQLNTTTLAVSGILEFLTSDNLLYGADAIQFVRWVNMGNLRTGKVFLGSVVYQSATITQVTIAGNLLTIAASNSFSVGDIIVLSGLMNASFLNGATVKVIVATSSSFEASYEFSGSYPATADTGFAESQNSGTTYETLVDLTQGQIIGTWDKSKLRNQFVQTGEILFTPDTTYSGAPIPPVLLQPTAAIVGGKTLVTISWQQERPDLINSYTVSYAIETQIIGVVPSSAPYTFQIPNTFTFTADEGVVDTASPIAITAVQVASNVITVTGANNFSTGQAVRISGLTGLTSIIGQTLTVLTASPTQFTASFTNPDYGTPNTVASVQVTSDVLTVQTTVNHDFSVGTQVSFNTLGFATFLNGQTVTIQSVGSSFFTASFTHANYGPTSEVTGNVVDADTGNGFVTINQPLVAVAGIPQAGQYTVNPTGLYTFNVAQAGHTATISIRQSFNTLQQVNSGATQTIVVPLAAAQTYFFEVEAFGFDGASGQSNIQSISI